MITSHSNSGHISRISCRFSVSGTYLPAWSCLRHGYLGSRSGCTQALLSTTPGGAAASRVAIGDDVKTVVAPASVAPVALLGADRCIVGTASTGRCHAGKTDCGRVGYG